MRNVVRQKLVARQLDEQLAERFAVGQRLRVLDVGMGQGTQALRLARAGHKVTGVDQDPGVIAAAREALSGEPEGIRERVRLVQSDGRDTGVHFLPGCFDVVLCHGVLMYAEERDALLAGLARMLAPGGLLSLLVRNGDALAMRPGLSGDWAGALGAFDTLSYSPDSLDFPGSPGSPDSPELSAVPEQGGPPSRLGHGLRADRLDALTATLATFVPSLRICSSVSVGEP